MASHQIPVTITYRKAGTQPPVFIAGTFSDPEWSPEELDYNTEDGEHTFKKQISAGEGTKIEYKFRLGLGEWWALDEDAPKVSDSMGNQNNVIEAVALESGQPDLPEAAGYEARSEARQESDAQSQKVENGGKEVPKAAANAQVEALRQETSVPRSGTSTPGFVRTTLEVADSAALLDKEEPEPDIPDEEAGQLGVRRLSSTPIPEVAKTAAEVADSAQLLDVEEDEDDSSREKFPESVRDENGSSSTGIQPPPIQPHAVNQLDVPGHHQTPERPSLPEAVDSTAKGQAVEGAEKPAVMLPAQQATTPKAAGGEDNGVGLGGAKPSVSDGEVQRSDLLSPETAASPEPTEPEGPTEPAPNTSTPIPTLDTRDVENARSLTENGTTTVIPENGEAESPRVVVHKAEPTVVDTAATTGTDANESTSTSVPVQRQKRSTPNERSGTPTPAHSTGMGAPKNRNWFRAFFKLVVVDWVGGFISRLFGRPKAVMTAGATAVIIGVVWWRNSWKG